MKQTRRQFLLGSTGVAAGALAGCLGSGERTAQGTDSPTVQGSFFVVSDFATQVAGDAIDVANLVPFGQHGHGWEPGPDIQRDILGSEGFVYVGEGFQPWADDIVANVRGDGADVTVVEAWAAVDLLTPGSDHEESETGTHDGHEAGSDDHDHGAADPHFWLDAARAGESVTTIADGLVEIDQENEATYRENAAAFTDRLTALDDRISQRLADRSRETVLVAGHNSFRYLGERYDFHVEALTGLAPDAEPTPRDVRRAQAVIEEHDIDHVLAPVFESDRAARQLVEETDATGTLPLTPVPSLTESWAERGWGFVDVMEKVNLPSLATALGAE